MNICPNLHNKKVKELFEELVSVFDENLAYYIWDKTNGYGLDLAPNGAESKLFGDLLLFCNGNRADALKMKAATLSSKFPKADSILKQIVDHLKKLKIKVHGTEDMKKYLSARGFGSLQQFIGKKARALFEQQLRKTRPDLAIPLYILNGVSFIKDPLSDEFIPTGLNPATALELQKDGLIEEATYSNYKLTEKGKKLAEVTDGIKSTLDFLHSLEDNKENNAYIKTAVRWVMNRSLTLPEDNTKARLVFDEARKRHIDVLKYPTLGALIASDEMKPKEKEKPKFDPDKAKTFNNKRTVTTKGGRVFTVYDVENTEEGQREVCKALFAHYKTSPWCLSTFTSTGEPTESAKHYWEHYNALPRKIAYENGKPVAFNSDEEKKLRRSIRSIELYDFRGKSLIVLGDGKIVISSPMSTAEAEELAKEGMLDKEALSNGSFRLTQKAIDEVLNPPTSEDREAWWDMNDRFAQPALSDTIVADPSSSALDLDFDPLPFDYDFPFPEIEDPFVGEYEDPLIDENDVILRVMATNELISIIRDIVRQNLHHVTNLDLDVNQDWLVGQYSELYLPEYIAQITDYIMEDDRRTHEEIVLNIVLNNNVEQHIRETINEYYTRLPQPDVPAPVAPVAPIDLGPDLPFYLTSSGLVYGFVTPEGEIYLDENVISPEHPIHEYTHLWDRAVAKKNPKLWKRGVELMKKTDLWEEILFDKNYGKKWTSNPNITPEELEFLVASEVHARIVGERGQLVLERIAKQKGGDSIVSKLKEWAFQFWKTIALTFSPWTQEQIDRLSYGDFVNIVLRDFAQDENVLELDENGEMSARDVICADPFYGRSVTSSQQTRCIISKLLLHFGDLILYNDKTKSFYLYYQNHPSFGKQNALTEAQLIDLVIQYCKYFFDKVPIIRRVGSNLNRYTGNFEASGQPAILGFAPNKSIFKDRLDKDITIYDNKCLIEQFLEQRFPEIQVHWVTRKELTRYHSNANAWYDIEKNCVCLVMDAVTSENVIEEFLHPITLMMLCSNPSVFDDLYDQAMEKYPEIRKQVDKLYGNEDEFVKRNEVVTKALSKVLDKKEKNKNRISVLQSIFKDVIDHISRISDGKYQVNVNKLPNITLDQFAQLICCTDVLFLTKDAALYLDAVKQKRLYNIANTLDPNEIHERLTDAMESLHRLLSSKKRTSITDTRRKQIHETLNKIRTADTIVLMLDFLGQAIESLGIPNQEDNTIPNDYTPNDPNSHPLSVWGALLKAKENDYADVDPVFLMDEFRFSIGFYEQTMKLLESFIHNAGILEQYMSDKQADEIREQAHNLKKVLRTVKSLWRDAVFTVGDQIVDNTIDEFVTAEKQDRESMKIVYKDWLHRNLYYGDINMVQKWAANYGRHQNSIIKMAFTLIGEANTNTQLTSYNEAVEIDKAFSRCNNSARKSLPFSWQDMFMERDRRGRYTGKFVRDLNFGQYEQDLNLLVSELNEKFDQDYGYHYIYNASGDLVRSDNLQLAEDESWGDSMTSDDCPVCIKYLNEINKWKGTHCHRRYTADYYGEMLSRPITATHQKAGEPFVDLPHGLSPKTYFKYNRLQEDINYILNDCTDPDTGYAMPEKLDPEDKLRLDRLLKELRDLANPFEDDGSLKKDEEYQIAIELCSWLTWIGKKLNTKVDVLAFEDECSKLTGQELDDFVKYNSYWGVHPLYSQQVPYANIPLSISVHEMDLRKSALLRMPSTTRDLFRELYQYRFSGEFWKNCRDCDQYIADNKLRQHAHTHDEFADLFYRELVPYIDEYGNYRTVTGLVMTPQLYGALVKQHREYQDDPSKPLVVLPELYSFKDYITDLYVQEALLNGAIPGFNDNNKKPVSFSGMSENDIRRKVEELFTYVYNYTDYDGTPKSETRPLSVFVTNQPFHDVFISTDKDNNVNVGPVVTNVPIGRFSTKVDNGNDLVDGEFDPQLRESEQPVRFDANGPLYDNSKAFNKLGEIGTPDRDLYELLVDTMRKKYLQAHPNATRYDHRLPLINASNSQILSRASRIGIKDAVYSVIESIYTVQENDTDMRTEESYIINPDGSKSLTLPRRFDSLLDDPQHISKDVAAGVKMYLYMSNNYKNMLDVEALLNMLEYNMRDDIRQTPLNHSEYGFKSAKRSDEVMKRMINAHVYEDLSEWGADTPMKVALSKLYKQVSKYFVWQLLAFNVMSVAVGFVDQMSRLLSVAFSGKLFSPIDFMYGLGSTLYHTPAMIWNMGKSYNKWGDKMVGTMAALGIGSDYREIVGYTSKSQLRNLVVNSALGAYSMMDYYGSSTALVAMMRQRKFYDGGVVPAGFYTSYELLNRLKDAGMSPMKARIHAYRSRLMSHTTMWGAIKIEPGGKFVIKPKWQQYIKMKDISLVRKSALQQGALFAGTNPKNDKPVININGLGMALTGMRGWLQQSLLWQGLLDGILDDTSVREFEKKEEEVIRHGKTTKKVKLKRKGRTDEQKYRRFSWNFEMGMPDDNVLTNVVRSIPRVIRSFCDLVTFNLGKATKRISYSERKAWRALIMYVASIVLIGLTISPLVDWANTAPAPPAYSTAKKLKSYQTYDAEYAREQSAAFMPWEDEYYDYQIYKLLAATVAMRTYQNKMDGISPIAAMDVIKQAVVTYSGYDRAQTAATEWLLWKTGILPDEEGEIIKQGSYKNFSKGERDIQMLVPGLRNIHTSFSHYGVQNNLRWYLQTFGNPEFKDVNINDNRPSEKKSDSKKSKKSSDINFDNDVNFDNDINFDKDMNFGDDMSFD